MANPSALNPQTEERILNFLRLGNHIETACKGTGIHKDTYYEWMKRARAGKDGDEKYVAFAQKVDAALAEAEARDVQTILMASKEQWQAAAWRLERRFPERWSRNDRVRLDGKLDVEVTDDGLVERLGALIRGTKDGGNA